jgi:hypothetical protein
MTYVSTTGLDRLAPWSPQQAVAYARGEVAWPDRDYSGQCLHFTAWCYGFGGAGATSATTFWHGTRHGLRHHGDHRPPAGAIVLWTGGSHGYGHATISAGGGKIYSTDIRRSGKVDLVPVRETEERWGLDFAGWVPPYFPGGWGSNPNRAPTITRRLPAVNLANMVASARNPDGDGAPSHPHGVRLIERALRSEGLLDPRHPAGGSFGPHTVRAYAEWQKRCGYRGADADGIPGPESLGKLGALHGFRVLAGDRDRHPV